MPGFELIGKEEQEAINEIFENSNGVLYRYGFDERRNQIYRVKEFEKKIAEKVNVDYSLFVNTGTAAEKLALIGLGVKPGDEVITQSFTFIATVEAILELGAIPVIAEIDKSLNMDPEDLKTKITSRTKAIIPVHMAGVPARMDEIMAIAKLHNIPVLEDSAQALGGTYKGKALGTIADAGIYSTDFGKAITTGEGGVLVTNNPQLHKLATEYSDHGHENNPNFPRGEDTRSTWGFNFKISEIAGAIGLAQLDKLDYIINKQREHKKYLKEHLSGIQGIEFRDIPDPQGDAADTLVFFVDNQELAKRIAVELREHGLGTKNLPDAINWHFAGTWTQIFHDFDDYAGKDLEMVWPKSTNLLRRAIALPVMVTTTMDELDHQVNVVREVLMKTL